MIHYRETGYNTKNLKAPLFLYFRIIPAAIRQPGYRLGKLAAEQLISRMGNEKKEPARIIIEPELIIRESCPKLF